MGGEEIALVGYVFFLPQTAHQLDGLVGAASAVGLGHAAGFVFVGVFLTQADRREEPALRQPIQRGNLLGENHRVPQRQGEDASAELKAFGVTGHQGQGDHGFQAEAIAANAVAEPDGVVLVFVAQLHQRPQEGGVVAPLSEGSGDIAYGNAHGSWPPWGLWVVALSAAISTGRLLTTVSCTTRGSTM